MMTAAEIQSIRGRYIETEDGVPLAIYEAGNPDGQTIVFLSGYSFGYSAFIAQFQSSLARTYRLIGVDLRGHGNSGKPQDPRFYISSKPWANDLDAVIRQTNLQRPLVVGWSFGAMVVMDWIRHHDAGLLGGFIAVGSNGGMIEKTAEEKRQRSVYLARLAEKQPDIITELREAKAFVSFCLHRPIPREWEELMVVSSMKPCLYASRLMGQKLHENHDLKDALTCPTLFILGEHDRANHEAEMRALANSLPNAQLAMMVDVGHSPFLEDPEAFNQLASRFAETIAPSL
jgi:pimeloyl-ACP methyl ester carboxylesterase